MKTSRAVISAHPSPAFTEREDLRRVVVTLPEEALLALLNQASREGDAEWLELALEEGVLDPDRITIVSGRRRASTSEELQDVWAGRVGAFMGCLDNMRVENAVNEAGQEHAVGRFELPTSLHYVVESFFAHVSDGYKKLCLGSTPTGGEKHGRAVLLAHSLAVLLDRIELLDLKAMPGVGAWSACWVNEARFERFFSLKPGTYIDPLFLAFQFNKSKSLEALLKGRNADDVPLLYPSQGNSIREAFEAVAFTASTQTAARLFDAITPASPQPAEINEDDYGAQMIRYLSDEAQRMVQAAMNAEGQEDGAHINAHMLPALADAGALDINPLASVKAALRNGHVYAIEHFRQKMPWDELERDLRVLDNAFEDALERLKVDGLLRMIEIARIDGRTELVLRALSMPRVSDASATRQMNQQCADVLVGSTEGRIVLAQLLQMGLDPNILVESSRGKTLHQHAMSLGADGAALILSSHLARSAALSALSNAAPEQNRRTGLAR